MIATATCSNTNSFYMAPNILCKNAVERYVESKAFAKYPLCSNGYYLFREENKDKENPDCSIGTIVAESWEKLSEREKEIYKERIYERFDINEHIAVLAHHWATLPDTERRFFEKIEYCFESAEMRIAVDRAFANEQIAILPKTIGPFMDFAKYWQKRSIDSRKFFGNVSFLKNEVE